MSSTRYGLPYQGSKNSIALDILRFLPSGNRLCDLCGGGGAITHAALASNTYKWNSFLYNEISPLVCHAFDMAIHGQFEGETRWISREDFFRLRDTDPYVAFCFSFGNNLLNYCYSRDIEPWKKAVHYARVLGDSSLLAAFGIHSDGSRRDIVAHLPEYRKKYNSWLKEICKGDSSRYDSSAFPQLESYARLQNLQHFESLERLESLTITCGSYESYSYLPGDVVYLDIPYENTDCKSYNGFDHAAFYHWASTRPFQIFFSSYHLTSPHPFFLVWEQRKEVFVDENHNIRTECIYSNKPYRTSLLPIEPTLF